MEVNLQQEVVGVIPSKYRWVGGVVGGCGWLEPWRESSGVLWEVEEVVEVNLQQEVVVIPSKNQGLGWLRVVVG